jgi:hypothetical protein
VRAGAALPPLTVTAMLAWFDEPPALLHQAIHSVAGLIDRLVAYDGGFRLFPDATPDSPGEQADTIRHACHTLDIPCDVVIPDRLWAGEVEKRDVMLRHAAAGSDWVMPLDADWVIEGDYPAARQRLAATGADVLTVKLRTLAPAGVWIPETFALVYRALDDMRVRRRHYHYSGVRDGQRIAFRGDDGDAATTDTLPGVQLTHLRHRRDPERQQQVIDYAHERDREFLITGIEP